MNGIVDRIVPWVLFLLMTLSTIPAAGEEAGTAKTPIVDWLVLGPVTVPKPALESEDTKTSAADLLVFPHVATDRIDPAEGTGVSAMGAEIRWKKAAAGDAGISLDAGETQPSVAYLAAWIEVPRWTKVDFDVRSTGAFELSIDAASVAKSEKGAEKPEDNEKSGTAKLEKGKHLALVKTVFIPGKEPVDWSVDVRFAPADGFDVEPSVSLDPRRTMTIYDVLDGPSVSNVDVSPDGKYVVLELSTRTPPEGTSDRWVEIRRFDDGRLMRTLRDVSGSRWRWAPVGNRLSYETTKEKKGTLRVLDLDAGGAETIVEDVEHLGAYNWSPDASFIVYSVEQEENDDKALVKRMRGLSDKRAGDRDRSYLYIASVPGGVTRRLTAGEYTTYLQDIHPDSRRALIERSWEDLTMRPYSQSELLAVDLESQTSEVLFKARWLGGAEWSPDGKKILVTGGPSTFGEAGRDVPEGVIPNDYDGQAYIFDPETKTVDAFTKHFDPSIRSVYWPKPGRDIYIVAEDGEYVRLFRYNLKKKSFKRIDLPCDVIHRSDVASQTPVAVLTGSGANQPWRVYAVDLAKGKVRTFLDPVGERFENVDIGKVEDFDFTTSAGTTIVGRVHYPPHFDAGYEWPCIVYYYGGTSPVSRSFGGRYPKNLWAAGGYVVYVLQPSGATGFGQEFSTRHVNDWGKVTSEEVIEGTKAFLAAHPFVDKDRVGCIGASYGGFMTELLVTRTDIFAAAVSHAGISSISSYWGEGYWGYGYNAVSAAESFPWNRRDIYVGQSPLFEADKVNTPLLLLHGSADTNVPRGESDQMYVALKLLGKEVEYIRVLGQNHWILDYKKRIAWNNAIVSWFDRWLKGEPEWWNDMYPPLSENKEEKTDE